MGELEYVNKDIYVGTFINGKREGKGNYYYSEGTSFVGHWEQDQKVAGELTLFNGDIFKGSFKNNERYNGIYYYKNGDQYEGYWSNDVKEGFGKLVLANG